MAPPGTTSIIISLLAEYDLPNKIQKAGRLDEFISEPENRVLSIISDSVYPMLKVLVISRFSSTPLSIEHRVGSSEKALSEWVFQKSMPVINKIQISDRSVLTPIPSIYQVGQSAYSLAGVPMLILTGIHAADRVLRRMKKFRKT